MRTTLKPEAKLAGVFMFVSLCFLILVLSAPMAFGKNSKSDADPLRPADTSSPRDTLNGFLSDVNQVVEDFRQNKTNEKTFQAFRRAAQTLDFSTTPESDSWFVRTRRVALLQELLARVEVPPNKEIPGDDEVATGAVSQWTVPNTVLTIAKIEQGPRAGQFLFSSDTVQQLDGLYRQAKQLPYKSGATVGMYEEMVSADSIMNAQESQLRNS